MGCTLYWIPVNTDKNYVYNHILRNILEKKFGFGATLSYGNIEYLQALKDADIEGAQELIEAIEKYEVIEIGQEC